MPTRQGSIKLFRLLGIDVYLHWAWFLAFVYFTSRPNDFSNYGWAALEILALFLIVLWPLGGVAYVNPPQRPGAQLWSIAAGPLVNVALVPVLIGVVLLAGQLGWEENHPDAYMLLANIRNINIIILIFNMLPVFPLDGGQILRSLLWFPFGRANSLMAASVIGLLGVAALGVIAIFIGSIWFGIMAAFIAMNCWAGLKQAQALMKIAKIPRREGFACPSCKSAPPLGNLWRCGQCGNAFDIFANNAACPNCGAQYNLVQCLDCGTRNAMNEWNSGFRT
jgi:Zn-dependent protease